MLDTLELSKYFSHTLNHQDLPSSRILRVIPEHILCPCHTSGGISFPPLAQVTQHGSLGTCISTAVLSLSRVLWSYGTRVPEHNHLPQKVDNTQVYHFHIPQTREDKALLPLLSYLQERSKLHLKYRSDLVVLVKGNIQRR